MIPEAFITEWSTKVPWASRDQVEQDLLLSRLIVAIASDEMLANELVFRGGTCFHKLVLPVPRRYSEDLDYVRSTGGPIGPVLDRLRLIGEHLGMKVATDIGRHPKVVLRGPAESGAGTIKVKIEINAHERQFARPLIRLPHAVDSQWFQGAAEVLTFDPTEMVATKLRAIYQRSKGRDVFDLWLALTELHLHPAEIADSFVPYRPGGYTAAVAEANLRRKLESGSFRDDLTPLVMEWPEAYDVDTAVELIISEILPHIR